MQPNKASAQRMHIDLNSCFAIIEQQANRLLRGKPVGVSAYDSPRGFLLAASYEAKRRGVKLGVNNAQARVLCPDITIVTPDPAKYREAHRRFKEVLLRYTNDVHAKSIDEFTMNLDGGPALRAGLSMEEIGLELKKDIAESLGEAVTVNVGIGPNRFLAKLAAGLNKPDGMDRIDHLNLEATLSKLELIDLPGINVRYKARLNAAGIFTPLQFLAADEMLLRKQVFGGIVGRYWYLRLRGYEIDAWETERRSIGHQYALKHKTTDLRELERLLMKLCEKTGRRLRKNDYFAQGIHLYLGFEHDPFEMVEHIGFEQMRQLRSWHKGHKLGYRLYSTSDIYEAAKWLLRQAIIPSNVRIMAITVFDIQPWSPEQMTIWGSGERGVSSIKNTSDAVDKINSRYGEFVITPALMMDMNREILDRIAFGQVRDI